MGTAVVGAFHLVLMVAVNRLNEGPGFIEGDGPPFLLAFAEFVLVLSVLPSAVLVVGIGDGSLLQLPRAWLVGLVAPVACWAVFSPLPNTGLVQFGITTSVYASVAALAAAWPWR